MINNNFSGLIGKNLIKLSDIAKSTGISRTTLTNFYYKRNKTVSLDILNKICGYLDCSISDILEYKKDID